MGLNVLQQIRQALSELGLPQPASLVTSGDLTALQMLGLWNALGQELYEQWMWKELIGTHTFDTVENQATYALPSDWAGPIDQTEWDRTNYWPLLGQKTPQEWQWLKSGIVVSGPRIRYRYIDNNIELFPTPVSNGSGFAPFTLSFFYYRNGWVIHPGSPPTTGMWVTGDLDTTYFGDRMMISGVKLKLWQIKGFDTKTLQADFERAFGTAKSRNQGAPVLSLAPRAPTWLIGPNNIQDGNWQVT